MRFGITHWLGGPVRSYVNAILAAAGYNFSLLLTWLRLLLLRLLVARAVPDHLKTT